MIWRPLRCRVGLHIWRPQITVTIRYHGPTTRMVTHYRCAVCDRRRDV